VIRLPAAVEAMLRAVAGAAYPEECCGLVVGRAEADGALRIDRAVASRNVAAAGRRRTRFEVDPAVRFAIMRELTGSPEALVGHYHSHPDRPAEPSDHDRAMAFEADLVWLIIPVAAGIAGRVRAWQPAADGFVERTIAIEAAAGRESGYGVGGR
jgi:proteasome lid subunit RPN8/RPN11